MTQTNGADSGISRGSIAANDGAVLTSRTTISTTLVALSAGLPSSVTRISTAFVLGPWASVGRQLTTPLLLTVTPAGAATAL